MQLLNKDRGSFPDVPRDLLERLEQAYPDRCPSPKDPERVIWMAAGAAEVVRLLRAHFNHQNNPQGG